MRLIGVRAIGNGVHGIRIESQGGIVDGCSAFGNGIAGISEVGGSLVQNSVARANGTVGIRRRLGATARLSRERAHGNNGGDPRRSTAASTSVRTSAGWRSARSCCAPGPSGPARFAPCRPVSSVSDQADSANSTAASASMRVVSKAGSGLWPGSTACRASRPSASNMRACYTTARPGQQRIVFIRGMNGIHAPATGQRVAGASLSSWMRGGRVGASSSEPLTRPCAQRQVNSPESCAGRRDRRGRVALADLLAQPLEVARPALGRTVEQEVHRERRRRPRRRRRARRSPPARGTRPRARRSPAPLRASSSPASCSVTAASHTGPDGPA